MKLMVSFFFCLSFLAIVTGCSTPYDLKRTKPKITYTTSRSSKDVMKCIRDKWRGHQATVYEEKISDGYLIRHDDVLPNATVAIVMIEDKNGETLVQYFHRTNRLKLHRLEEEILDCKE
jgi:hypothetical protein